MTTPEELHVRALGALERGDTAGAVTDLRAYVEAEPDDERGWLELGTAYAAIDHWPDAAKALAQAVKLDGTVVDARLAFARALRSLNKIDDAAFQLLQASRLDAGDARVLKELGILFYERRLYDKAAHWLERAALAAPGDARASYALGLAHEARKDVGGAVAAYREALRRDPSFPDAHKTLADLLASMGEHEQAIAELEALLGIERTNEQAAHNRDVLVRALADMRSRRLLGKTERELELSALVQEGQLKRKGRVIDEAAGAGEVVRYAAALAELWITFDAAGVIRSLMLVLPHPDRAAKADDDAFRVTVVGQDGTHVAAKFATAVSLTFLREALGCPMTHASELYGRLLRGETGVEWGGATLEFASVAGSGPGVRGVPAGTETGSRHGIVVRAKEPAG